MKIALFSDIHSNIEAFTKVLDALKQEKVDRYVFLGDLIGYGASPRECIQLLKTLIKEKGCLCVTGNHDRAVCGLTPYHNYAAHVRMPIEWTQEQLNPQEMKFLAGLPLLADSKSPPFTIVHANLAAPEDWGYLCGIDDAFKSFQKLAGRLCFVGHSHKPLAFTCGEVVDCFVSEAIKLRKDLKYIINVGSVGQPRDGNPKACYAVYDSEADLVTIKRVDYAIPDAQAKIIAAGLPIYLSERLARGE